MLKYQKYARYFKYVFAAAPALACLFLVLRYGVNTVISDEWVMVILGQKAQNGALTFADLWMPFNEHRHFFFRLLYLAVAFLTKFNAKAQMMVSFAMVCAAYFCMVRYLFSKVGDEIRRCAGGFVLGLLMFSPAQWHNFTYGGLLGFIMADALPPISIYFLYRRISGGKRRYLVFALALGVVASFSSLQGLLVWPAALAMLALHYRKAVFRQPLAAVWLGTGAASWILYFYGLYDALPYGSRAPLGEHLSSAIKHPLSFLYQITRTAVAPFFDRIGLLSLQIIGAVCMLAIAVVVALFGFRLITRYTEEGFIPGALALFGLMAVVLVTLGRQGWDMNSDSRHTTATLLLYVGTVLYALVNLDVIKNGVKVKTKSLRRTAAGLLAAIVLASAIAWPEGFVVCRIVRESSIVSYAAALKEYKTATDAALLIYGPPPFGHAEDYTAQEVRELARFLEENGYSVFAGAVTSPRPPR